MYTYTHPSGSSSGTSVSVPLPASMSAGAVIGRGGQNIKLLQQRSGARVAVNKAGTEVIISGTPSAIQTANNLLSSQIEAFLSTGGGYPHPLQVHYILGQAYGSDVSCRLVFKPRQDAVASATGRHEQLYQLQPESAASAAGHDAPRVDALVQALTGMQLGNSSHGHIPLHLHTEQASVVSQMVAAADKGIRHRPAFDEMKIRFNFGKCLWYNGAFRGSWSIQEMRGKQIPRDLKSVYSNAVLPQQLSKLQFWLHRQGFSQVETKEQATVHLLHLASSSSFALSLIKHRDGRLELRKAKTAGNKLFFLTLLGRPDEPDWRAKLLALYHFNQDSHMYSLLSSVVASAKLLRPHALQLPNLEAHDMTVNKERHKFKTIYEGAFSGGRQHSSSGSSISTLIKVTVSKVLDRDEGASDGSFEVSGTSPQLNELLAGMVRSGRVDCSTGLATHINNMLTFARHAAAVMSCA